MIKIVAVLCSLSSPANCHERIVTTSDFADVRHRCATKRDNQFAPSVGGRVHATEETISHFSEGTRANSGGHLIALVARPPKPILTCG